MSCEICRRGNCIRSFQSLEQLERIWGKLATAEQDFELCLEENKRLKELLTEIVHRLVK